MYNEVQVDWTVRRINVWLPCFFSSLLLTAHCCLWPFKLMNPEPYCNNVSPLPVMFVCTSTHVCVCVHMRDWVHLCISEWIWIIHSVCMCAAWMYIYIWTTDAFTWYQPIYLFTYKCVSTAGIPYRIYYCMYPICSLCGCTCWKYHLL